jgi:hypothetical protein
MKARLVRFGEVEVDGTRYERDIVIADGRVTRRHKRASKPYRDLFGHTPLSLDEAIPWGHARLVVGTGAEGRLPIMEDVRREARDRGVELIELPTAEACRLLAAEEVDDLAAILHVTC